MSELSSSPLDRVTLTFLFTDIEGSTRLLRRVGERYAALLEEHGALIRQALAEAAGTVVDTEGDAFFVVFATPSLAVSAGLSAQQALAAHPWPDGAEVRVRMGLHTGEAVVRGDRYTGLDVHRAARIADAGHGGQILVSEAVRILVSDNLPDGVTLRDLGHHRFKDLAEPEHLFQVVGPGLASAFPSLRSLDARPHNLPNLVTGFVGRQRELEQARALLDDVRLLTLTGPGGTGKTRLAIEMAREQIARFPDGAFFVSLAGVGDPALVPAAVAQALGVRSVARPVLEALKDHLATRQLLLVLDNFEHLLASGPVVNELLQAAPRLRVLVTSRALLCISGEQELPVPPMELPDAGGVLELDALSRYDALALFVQRARTADPGFRLTDRNAAAIARICTRLDGLPLAIELAAARLNVLTPELLLQRLESRLPALAAGPADLPARQRTLRDTVAWSHDLLGAEEKAVFRRLSVFSGGCTLAAAEMVADGDGVDVLEGLSSLVAKSLLRRVQTSTEPRFRMLSTIREYARERALEHGEAEALELRHTRLFLELAEDAAPRLTGNSHATEAARLQGELDNLREAMSRSLRTGKGEEGLRIASALWRFWQQQGQLEEGRQWLGRLLGVSAATGATATRAAGLVAEAGLAYWQGDYGLARADYEESLSIRRHLRDDRGAAEALSGLAFLAGIEGDYARAHALHQEALALARRAGDSKAVAYELVGDGMICRVEGDAGGAWGRFVEARRLFEELGESYGLATVLCLLSGVALERGDLEEAEAFWERAFQLLQQLEDRSGMIIALSDLSALALARGRTEAAVRLAGAAHGLARALKVSPPTALTQPADPRPVAYPHLGEEPVEAAWRSGCAMTYDEAVAYALEVFPLDAAAVVGVQG
ncbi:MAG: tetratricopeptide repeat protein [Actinomycetota bacterium]|nr:tetratricopeptide repeat protein [Actinomycetota bacterium]